MAHVGNLDARGQSSVTCVGDEELVARARSGCWRATEYLLGRYSNLVQGKASAYYVAGADHEDVVQEGMIGLYKAIRDFSADHLCAFRPFAELCITRQIITAIKTARRQKHLALNTYVSTDVPTEEGDEERTLGETLPAASSVSPEELAIAAELRRKVHAHIRRDLSSLEARALLHYLRGDTYQDIANALQLNLKQVDNALQRAKRKLARCTREFDITEQLA